MSKLRETIAFQELLTSSKTNQLISDYITPGKLIMHVTGCWFAHATPSYIGWWPFNPNKNVFDRIRILGQAWTPAGGGQPLGSWLEYTLDSGGSWTAIGAGINIAGLLITLPADPIGIGPPPTELTLAYWDVDISSIAATELIGFRLNDAGGGGGHNTAVVDLSMFLYLSTETPF